MLLVSPEAREEGSTGGVDVTYTEIIQGLGEEPEGYYTGNFVGNAPHPSLHHFQSLDEESGIDSSSLMSELPTANGSFVYDDPEFAEWLAERYPNGVKYGSTTVPLSELQFWKEVDSEHTGRGSVYSIVFLPPAREYVSETKGDIDFDLMESAIEDYELGSEKKGQMMRTHFDSYSVFNSSLDMIQRAFKEKLGANVDIASAAAFIAGDITSASNLTDLYVGREGVSLEDVNLSNFSQNELGDMVYDFSQLTAEEKQTLPFDFDTRSRVYGETTTDENGSQKETGEWFTEAQTPGWSQHPTLGKVLTSQEDPNRVYDGELGWLMMDKEKSSDWVYSEELGGKWLYPREGGRMFVHRSTPETQEWKVPDFTDGRYYNVNEGRYEINTPTTTTQPAPVAEEPNKLKSIADPQSVANPQPVVEQQPIKDESMSYESLNPTAGSATGWYQDKWGAYFQSDNPQALGGATPNYKYRTGSSIDGWWYEEDDTNWIWSEDTGWMWGQPTATAKGDGHWFWHKDTGSWVYSSPGDNSFVDESGTTMPMNGSSTGAEPGATPDLSEVPIDNSGKPATPLSYADRFFMNGSGEVEQLKDQLNKEAQTYRNMGADESMISNMLKKTSVYKRLMKNLGGEDGADARALVDEIVGAVAVANAQKANIAGSLDMLDNRGYAALDPRLTLEQKGDIRFAKPTIKASQFDVDEGRASVAGEVINNPNYDPEYSMFFEHINPVTGEKETRAFRSDMPGKQPFMKTQETLIDTGSKLLSDYANEISQVGEDGKTSYQRSFDGAMGKLREAGIVGEGGDDLFTKEGIKGLNYMYGDDKDSAEGKLNDYLEARKFKEDEYKYYDALEMKDTIDKGSRVAAAYGDYDPVENARIRGAERLREARFGKNKRLTDQKGLMFDDQLSDKIDPINLNSVTGADYGSYSPELLNAAKIGSGFAPPSLNTPSLKTNQYLA